MTTLKPLILAIDDTPANLLTLGTALESKFDVQIATSGAMGLALAQQSVPDLILLDIMMPEMDGFETCRRLKAMPGLRDIPLVFVSALTEIESESTGLALGAADYITKPVNVQIALQRICNLVEREALRKDVLAQRDQMKAHVAELEKSRLALTQTQIELRESDAFKHAILNSLTPEIAVLDEQGVIRAVNEPWQRFARQNTHEFCSSDSVVSVGKNYLEVCRKAVAFSGPEAPLALAAMDGIQAVIDGTSPGFGMEYPCHSPAQERWFAMVVSPLQKSTRGGVVIAHTDITERKRNEGRLEQVLFEQKARIQFGDALNEVAQAIIEGDDSNSILANVIAIIGKTLMIDRVLIYDVSFDKHLVSGIFQWLNPLYPDLPSSLGTYPLDVFIGGATEIQRTKQCLTSQVDDVNAHFLADGSGALLHQKMGIQSLLWYPFGWNGDNFSLLVINQMHCARHWTVQDLDFLNSVSRQVNIALTKIELLVAQQQAHENLQLAASVFTHAREGITITDTDGTIIDVNDSFSRITGYSREEVLGENPRILNSGRQGSEFYTNLWHQLTTKGHWYGELWNRRKNGTLYAEMLTITAVCTEQGKPDHYVALFSDITAFKEHEDQLNHIAHYDALTNLPNRVLLADRLRQGMAQEQRRDRKLVVVFLDLDGFKSVNDNYGHEAGDQLLITVATRMKECLRECDTLARIGGDEFVAVLSDLEHVNASVPLLTRLLNAAAQPVLVNQALLQVSASLGVTYFPQAQDIEADQLLRQADQAMYQAKLAGKNRFSFFDPEQDIEVRSVHKSIERIRQALVAREFVLYYQPKVNMCSGQVIGVEALIRWQHPDNGLLAPALFLPVIEDHPLAVELGDWVIDTALGQMATWHASGLDMRVSINVGARQLQQSNFVIRLQELLAAHPQVSPASFEIEILEASALEDLPRVSRVIEDCRALGVQFAMDDFGTGYSSLTYLRHLRVNVLKIDRSFVRDVQDDVDNLAILQGVIGLAKSFRRLVIAEGVETVAHGTLLLQLGCDLGQGFGIARPMPAHELPNWVEHWRPDAAWLQQAPALPANLPLLYARIEHRAWVAAIGASLRGERLAPPPHDPHQCSFARWLDTEGFTLYGTRPNYSAIDELHRQIHALGTDLLALQTQGRTVEALEQWPVLEGLRDSLTAQLDDLARTSA